MFSKTVYGTTFKDVNFVPLQSATFCIQCELIGTNSRPFCLACGNTSLLSLSQTAHLITDSELDSLVRDLLRTVPDPQIRDRESLNVADFQTRQPSSVLRSQLRVANAAHPVSGFRAVHPGEEVEIHSAELDLEPAISAITERAQHLTGATGAAIALPPPPVQGIGNGLPFFGRSAVVKGENALPVAGVDAWCPPGARCVPASVTGTAWARSCRRCPGSCVTRCSS